ncbi:CTP synthase [Mycoplasma sp. CSL10137]|uniref:CTP synthase n=1 Tax=unclassified Mycoplasma TaxID=2683645 RepID=UPI00197BFEA0|nr:MULTISPECIES: CTP synthase [unclassified Mycoplasma]MBN4083431.1 CTP synthase [Mycoplasma sp. CSL10137]MBU4692724.1 CTP synthase [Mycoplasma sp. CSL7491-lung]
MSKFIFVTGGVISGLGKGVSAASLGNLLKARGFSIFVLKLDPYLNVDPGVMSPYEHGEVYVTKDGGETDLDLGHYERFIDENFSKDSNYTSGRIFQNILNKERKGFYNGKTVQYIPHVTNEIISIIKNIEDKYKKDFVIVEIGGTVGDIESNPFIYSLAQMSYENEDNTYFIHVTYVPFLKTSKDFKTKPTQFSVSALKGMGVRPNMIFLRSDYLVPNEIIKKVANSSHLPIENIISTPDLKNIYDMPLYLESKKVVQNILNHFHLKDKKPKLKEWENFIKKVNLPRSKTVDIKMLGKYTSFTDAYKSINEALEISAIHLGVNLNLEFIDSSILNSENLDEVFSNVDGVVILPGFGARGFEGKVLAADFCKRNKIPTLGICLGMQAMTVAQARRKGIVNATSREFANDKLNETYVLDFIDGKSENDNIGGTLRLGDYETEFIPNSKIAKFYQKNNIFERHRHRFEVQNKYIKDIEDETFKFTGFNPEHNLVESCEDPTQDFYIGVQYHPEFTSRPLKPHKLFMNFLKFASKKNKTN